MVVVPTYNEAENLQRLIDRILEQPADLEIVIVDDGSPDGTGRLADEISAKNPKVHVLHREGKLGLGTAYVAGFRYALSQKVDVVFEMDADFSHDPKELPNFLARVGAGADVVIGSRYVHGVRVMNWSFKRLLLSKMATLYVDLITGMGGDVITDATAGFKCYRREVLESIDLDRIHSNGYAFQIEMKYRAYRKGFKLAEIPITFNDRHVGQSKMSKKIIFEALWIVWRLRLGL